MLLIGLDFTKRQNQCCWPPTGFQKHHFLLWKFFLLLESHGWHKEPVQSATVLNRRDKNKQVGEKDATKTPQPCVSLFPLLSESNIVINRETDYWTRNTNNNVIINKNKVCIIACSQECVGFPAMTHAQLKDEERKKAKQSLAGIYLTQCCGMWVFTLGGHSGGEGSAWKSKRLCSMGNSTRRQKLIVIRRLHLSL